MKKERLLILLGSCLALSFLFSIIAPYSRPAPPPVKILKLGATSNFADRQGIQLKKILEMNAELINEAGGLEVKGERYKIEMIVYDDKYKADVGRAAFEKLVFEDKIRANVGTYASAPLMAGKEITEPNKIPVFHNAVSPEFLKPEYKYLTHCYSWVPAVLYGMWKFRVERYEPKTVVMVEYDDVTGRAMAKMNADIVAKFPAVKLTQLYLPHGAPDATPIATKIKSVNPNLLYIGSVMGGAEIFRLVKAIHEIGWKGGLDSTYLPVALPEIVEKLGKQVVEGATTEQIKDPTEFSWCPKLLLEHRKNYEKKYGVWENDAIGWTGGWYVFQALVKKAHSLDPDVLMDAREGLEFDCLWGRGKLVPRPDMRNPRHVEAVYPKYTGVIKDGKLVHLRTLTVESTLKAAEELYGIPVLPR